MDLIVLGALFLDQEFRLMGGVERDGKGILEIAFHEEERGKDLFLAPGGSAASVALRAVRLGLRTRALGRLGDDPFAVLIREGLRGEGVDIEGLLSVSGERTGTTVILSGKRDGELDLAMITHGGANEALEVADVEPALLRDDAFGEGGILYVGDLLALPRLQPGLADLLAALRKRGVVTCLDHGRLSRSRTPRRTLDDLRRVLGQVDIYLPSESEIREATGCRDLESALEEAWSAFGIELIAAKRGSAGCAVRHRELRIDVPAFPARDGVSALGAGSAFNAAFLSAWRDSPTDLEGAARFANAAGRLKIVSGKPADRHRLRTFLEQEGRGRR